jgi:hypothetical protein
MIKAHRAHGQEQPNDKNSFDEVFNEWHIASPLFLFKVLSGLRLSNGREIGK